MAKFAWVITDEKVALVRERLWSEINYKAHQETREDGTPEDHVEVYIAGENQLSGESQLRDNDEERDPADIARLMAIAVLQDDMVAALALSDWLQENLEPEVLVKP